MQELTEEEQKTVCQICGKVCLHLGSHLRAHKISSREYKEEFGLDFKFSLISEEVRLKKQIAFNKNRDFYLKNILSEKAKKYRFKKGHSNLQRISEQSEKRNKGILKLLNENSKGKCPICNMNFDHLASHLANAHGLQKLKK